MQKKFAVLTIIAMFIVAGYSIKQKVGFGGNLKGQIAPPYGSPYSPSNQGNPAATGLSSSKRCKDRNVAKKLPGSFQYNPPRMTGPQAQAMAEGNGRMGCFNLTLLQYMCSKAIPPSEMNDSYPEQVGCAVDNQLTGYSYTFDAKKDVTVRGSSPATVIINGTCTVHYKCVP